MHISYSKENLKECYLVWLLETSDRRDFFSLGRVTETTDGSEGVIRPAIFRINDGVYKILVVRLAPILPELVFSQGKTGSAM